MHTHKWYPLLCMPLGRGHDHPADAEAGVIYIHI